MSTSTEGKMLSLGPYSVSRIDHDSRSVFLYKVKGTATGYHESVRVTFEELNSLSKMIGYVESGTFKAPQRRLLGPPFGVRITALILFGGAVEFDSVPVDKASLRQLLGGVSRPTPKLQVGDYYYCKGGKGCCFWGVNPHDARVGHINYAADGTVNYDYGCLEDNLTKIAAPFAQAGALVYGRTIAAIYWNNGLQRWEYLLRNLPDRHIPRPWPHNDWVLANPKPKFKVGDWVLFDGHRTTKYPWKIGGVAERGGLFYYKPTVESYGVQYLSDEHFEGSLTLVSTPHNVGSKVRGRTIDFVEWDATAKKWLYDLAGVSARSYDEGGRWVSSPAPARAAEPAKAHSAPFQRRERILTCRNGVKVLVYIENGKATIPNPSMLTANTLIEAGAILGRDGYPVVV